MNIKSKFKKSIRLNMPYFIFSLNWGYSNDISDKDILLEYTIKSMGITYYLLDSGLKIVILGIRDLVDYPDERNLAYNCLVASSFYKAFNIPLIVGIGNSRPIIINVKGKRYLENNDFDTLMLSLIPDNYNGFITHIHSHVPKNTSDARLMRELHYHQSHKFGIDFIPVWVVLWALFHHKRARVCFRFCVNRFSGRYEALSSLYNLRFRLTRIADDSIAA